MTTGNTALSTSAKMTSLWEAVSPFPYEWRDRLYQSRSKTAAFPNVVGRFRTSYLFVLILSFMWSAALQGERLPIKAYTTADGLPHNTVIRIVKDSHGFLWFCTLRGLSRFDGYTFANYGAAQGLPGQIADLLEASNGDYWVASSRGLYRFRTHPGPGSTQPMFVLMQLAGKSELRINALRQDTNGSIWVGTTAGLYRLTQTATGMTAQLMELATPGRASDRLRAQAIYEDREGATWVSLQGEGLRRFLPNGQVERYTSHGFPITSSEDRADNCNVGPMLEDREGRLWLACDHGLSVLVPQPGLKGQRLPHTYTTKDGLPDDDVESLVETSDGTIWAGTLAGLSKFCPASLCSKDHFESLVSPSIGRVGSWALAEDKDGNLWMGSDAGALRIAREGFAAYDEADGLGSGRVYSVFDSPSGDLFVITGGPGRPYINRLEGNRFAAVLPRLPGTLTPVPGPHQPVLLDHTGEWWVASNQGFFRYGRVNEFNELARKLPKPVLPTPNGLPPGEEITHLYEDGAGNVWIASFSTSIRTGSLIRWDRSHGTFHTFSPSDGLTTQTGPTALCEDRSGDLWIGFRYHDLARYRNGRFTIFTARDGLPASAIMRLYLDREGRLWVATMEAGAVRVDHPEEEHPQFVNYTTSEGLSSNLVGAITEDHWGRIYFLTDLSVDRLDPKTGAIKHYISADSPLSSHGGVAFADHDGVLWFGTLLGLSRLMPTSDESVSPPPIRIRGIHVRGESLPISELGEAHVGNLRFQPDQNQVEIDFASLSFSAGEAVRYQYKLENADRDWSTLSEQRTVNYAALSPGRYRFLVRAVNWRGIASTEPAGLEFRILPPLWRRWWAFGLFSVLVLSTVYALYRFRLGQLLELERVRTRIATDLHDDIGSNLTQISILSEVVRQRVRHDGAGVSEPLMRIADLSRELVDSMSDIVWAVNPRRDHIVDLAQRMRRFASDVLSARNIEFKFHTRDGNLDKELRTDKRRQVFLVFKEAINNIVRHSECKGVTIELGVDKGELVLKLCDDGRGFDPAKTNGNTQGHGLESMAGRARSIGAQFNLRSHPGQGTTISLSIPV